MMESEAPMRFRFAGCIGMAVLVLSGCAAHDDPCSFLPAEFPGWKAAAPDGQYTADTLFSYIDGGAEVYRALNVRRVCARRYVRDDQREIVADLFEMSSSSDAFGAYHHDPRPGTSAGIGHESEISEGSLAFWKGRYFVSIVVLQGDPETGSVVRGLAARIAGAIREEGEPPDLLKVLPADAAREVRYFHSADLFSKYRAAQEASALGLRQDTEGIHARFEAATGGGVSVPATIVAIRYPSVEEAARAGRAWAGILSGNGSGEIVGQNLEGSWYAVAQAGPILVAALDMPSREGAEAVLARLQERARGLNDRSRG
jgi:hypothetical protein